MHDRMFADHVADMLVNSIKQEQAEIQDLLEERATTCEKHGSFADAAGVTQSIKSCMEWGVSKDQRTDSMNYALDMIAGKMGRITVGDPFHADHWRDIAGYATLVANELARQG